MLKFGGSTNPPKIHQISTCISRGVPTGLEYNQKCQNRFVLQPSKRWFYINIIKSSPCSEKGIGVDERWNNVPLGVCFDMKGFHSISIDFIFWPKSLNCYNFPGMAAISLTKSSIFLEDTILKSWFKLVLTHIKMLLTNSLLEITFNQNRFNSAPRMPHLCIDGLCQHWFR